MSRQLNPEDWLTIIAILFVVGISIIALLPEGAWESSTSSVAPRVQAETAPDRGNNTMISPAPQMVIPQQRRMEAQPPPQAVMPQQRRMEPQQRPAQAVTPERIGRVKAQPGLIPFEQAKRVRFKGTVQQITEAPRNDGHLHLWLHDAKGREIHLSVAPDWFLTYLGCPLQHDILVAGSGFQFDRDTKSPLIYAKKVIINNRTCHLRNDEGFALWSNQLR
ncbi:hypothetical protein ACQZV8_16220 [Magnetococcales bacterium HHB-1]